MVKKLCKKLFIMSLAIFLSLVLTPDIFAETVKINGGLLDIYETGGEGSATFDKTTNTLTLENYENGSIIFDGFSGKTINVVVRGENSITAEVREAGSVGLGIDSANNNIIFNITGENGSSLFIQNYDSGIFNNDGQINVSNMNIDLSGNLMGIYVDSGNMSIDNSTVTFDGTDIPNGIGLYVYQGDLLKISNSNLDIKNSDYAICNDHGDVELDNIIYKDEKVYADSFYVGGDVVVKNSSFDVKTGGALFNTHNIDADNLIVTTDNKNTVFFADFNLSVKNSTVTSTGEDTYYIFKGDNIVIDNNNIVATDAAEVFDGDNALIKNSKILADNVSNFASLENVEFVNSYVDTNSIFVGLILYSNLKVNNSYVKLNAEQVALFLSALDNTETFDDKVILTDVSLLETGLLKGVAQYQDFITQYIYSYVTALPEGVYTDENEEELIALAAKTVTYVPTFYIEFDANGGTGTMDVLLGKGVTTLPDNGFTAPSGKQFKGWSLTPNGDVITSVDITGKMKVYAIWENVPETLDNVLFYGGIAAFSIIGLSIALIVMKKNN